MTKNYPIGLSGSTLKIIAIIAMVIDHIGFGIWYRLPELGYLVPETLDFETWWSIYRIMRSIGRTAFPIFCFLLVQGFRHTGSHFKYSLRLFAFALISQLPFRYALLDLTDSLNVFFTLFIGFITIWGMNEVKKKYPNRFIYLPAWILVTTAAAYLAYRIDTDYDYKGVLLIVILFVFERTRICRLVIAYVSFTWLMSKPTVTNFVHLPALITDYFEFIGTDYCFPGFILPGFYNGKRGLNTKYPFYLVYPVHLMLIFIVWRFVLS